MRRRRQGYGCAPLAQQRGWTFQRGPADDWDLQLFPKAGEKIIFTENVNAHSIQYMCEGERFDQDEDLCASEVRGICVDAFGESCGGFG